MNAGQTPAVVPWPLPKELLIDTDMARQIIVGFIASHLRQTGFERALLGLSGGIDSALCAYLVAEAIGPDNLLCLLLPYRTSSPASRTDAEEVVRRLGCESRLIEITPIVDGYFETALGGGEDVSQLRRGNLAARARMAVLYDQSVPWRGLVLLSVALLFFGLTVRGLGVVPSLFVTTSLAGLASVRVRPLTALVIGAGLTATCVIVFIVALQLRLPLFGPWIRF